MKRSAHALWSGDLKSGNGNISVESGLFSDAPYSFKTRFESEKGTNPEELIAAAHAGCLSMALSHELAENGMNPENVETKASLTLEKTGDGFTITAIHLDVDAHVPGADKTEFTAALNRAKTGCPVSKLLNAKITVEANLKSQQETAA